MRNYEEMVILALEAGIIDRSYDTPRQGFVASYMGEATINFEGKTFKCVGHDTEGDPMNVTKEGYIQFTEIK